MDHLARYAIAKGGLADAVRQATSAPGSREKPGYAPMFAAADLLLLAEGNRYVVVWPKTLEVFSVS